MWLSSALLSRFAQLDYIAQDSPRSAISQDEEIEKQLQLLLTNPKFGRPGRIKSTRELVIGRTPFIVAYRIVGERVEILRVLHGSQKWPDDMQSMLKD